MNALKVHRRTVWAMATRVALQIVKNYLYFVYQAVLMMCCCVAEYGDEANGDGAGRRCLLWQSEKS